MGTRLQAEAQINILSGAFRMREYETGSQGEPRESEVLHIPYRHKKQSVFKAPCLCVVFAHIPSTNDSEVNRLQQNIVPDTSEGAFPAFSPSGGKGADIVALEGGSWETMLKSWKH
ncbi:hypothetical protein DMENIID0001_091470 [Sergentomyia squamirostris]